MSENLTTDQSVARKANALAHLTMLRAIVDSNTGENFASQMTTIVYQNVKDAYAIAGLFTQSEMTQLGF